MTVLADSNEPKPSRDNTVILYPTIPTNRPNTPGNDIIVCQYGNGYMEFSLPISMEFIVVSIKYGDMIIWSGEVSVDSPCIEIPYLIGEYEIECLSDTNQVYIGTLLFTK